MIFIPFQPEIELKTDNYLEYVPTQNIIRQNISCFYQFKTPKNSLGYLSVIPDGCFDIIFECSSDRPRAYLCTSPEKSLEKLFFQSNCVYFGIRFLPEQKILKFQDSMKHLINKKIPLEDVIHSTSFLAEEVNEEESFIGRINTFEKYLKTLNQEEDSQVVVNYCIKRIYQFEGQLIVQELPKETGYSDRYLRKKFEESIGFSPKQFSEVVRFQKILKVICKEDVYNLQDIAIENGYHDLSHCIKGFKKFVNLTPNKYKEKINS